MKKLFCFLATVSAICCFLLAGTSWSAEKKKATPSSRPYSSIVHHDPQEANIGVGLILGEPTGLSAKYFLNHQNAIDAGLAYSFFSFFMIYGDFLWEINATNYFEPNSFTEHLKLYYGGGAGVKFSTKDSFARVADHDDQAEFFFRVPVGMEWRMAGPSLGFFFEVAPGLKILPSASAMLFAAVGGRFYF